MSRNSSSDGEQRREGRERLRAARRRRDRLAKALWRLFWISIATVTGFFVAVFVVDVLFFTHLQ